MKICSLSTRGSFERCVFGALRLFGYTSDLYQNEMKIAKVRERERDKSKRESAKSGGNVIMKWNLSMTAFDGGQIEKQIVVLVNVVVIIFENFKNGKIASIFCTERKSVFWWRYIINSLFLHIFPVPDTIIIIDDSWKCSKSQESEKNIDILNWMVLFKFTLLPSSLCFFAPNTFHTFIFARLRISLGKLKLKLKSAKHSPSINIYLNLCYHSHKMPRPN